MADDQIEGAPKPGRQAQVGQVGLDKPDAARLRGAPLQAPGDRDGAGAEVDRDNLGPGQPAAQVERLGAVSAAGKKDAGQRAIAGSGAPDRVDPLQGQAPGAALERFVVAERIRPAFIDLSDSVGDLHTRVAARIGSGRMR